MLHNCKDYQRLMKKMLQLKALYIGSPMYKLLTYIEKIDNYLKDTTHFINKSKKDILVLKLSLYTWRHLSTGAMTLIRKTSGRYFKSHYVGFLIITNSTSNKCKSLKTAAYILKVWFRFMDVTDLREFKECLSNKLTHRSFCNRRGNIPNM